MEKNNKDVSFEGLDLILDPVVVIGGDYRVLYANKVARELFGEDLKKSCYSYIYGFNEPCWKYAGYHCPIKDREEGIKKELFVQYVRVKDNFVKKIVREYCLDGTFVELYLPYEEFVEAIKEYPSYPRKKDDVYLSKGEFETLLNKLLAEKKHFYLITVNIKKLKYINEIYGIPAGDLVIKAVEQVLSKLSSKYKFKFAQVAGGYFIIFLDQNLEQIEKFERELLDEFKKVNVLYMGKDIYPRISITTIEVFPQMVKNLKLLYKLIFYAERVRDTREIFHLLESGQREIIEFLQRKEELTQKLQKFIKEDSVLFYLQPVVDMETLEISHFEILMRFKEDGKIVSAGKYIDIIYELGLIVDFDLKLLEKLEERIEDLKKLRRPIFLNVSAEDLKVMNYRRKLKALIERFQREACPVYLELTEQVVFQEWDFIETLAEEYGLRIAVDDFGSGYSSLKLVADLVSKKISDTVKIDMSLTRDYLKNPYTRAMVDSLALFSEKANVHLIAEGIENEELYEALKAAGIKYGQGWHFYKPMPLEEALKLVSS